MKLLETREEKYTVTKEDTRSGSEDAESEHSRYDVKEPMMHKKKARFVMPEDAQKKLSMMRQQTTYLQKQRLTEMQQLKKGFVSRKSISPSRRISVLERQANLMRKKSVFENISENNKLLHKNTKTAERLAGIQEEVIM